MIFFLFIIRRAVWWVEHNFFRVFGVSTSDTCPIRTRYLQWRLYFLDSKLLYISCLVVKWLHKLIYQNCLYCINHAIHSPFIIYEYLQPRLVESDETLAKTCLVVGLGWAILNAGMTPVCDLNSFENLVGFWSGVEPDPTQMQ